MIRRNTWIILAVFVVLVGVAWYLQRNGGSTEAQATSTPQPVLLAGIDSSQISELKIQDNQGATVVLEQPTAGDWKLVEPQAEATDVAKVQSAVDQLLAVNVLDQIATPPPAEATGLDQPVHTISLQLQDGRQIDVNVGSATPIENGYYVQIDQGSIYVVRQFGIDGIVGLLEDPPIQPTPTPTTPPTMTPEPSSDSTPVPSTETVQPTPDQ
ncbi:MAG: hypothetical protein P8074_16115 [Anaerolineales bacterium]|jgi:hypothetical protein